MSETVTRRYYQPLEVPRFCHLWEAVLWVTFGRFPMDMVEDTILEEELGTLSYSWQSSIIGANGYKFDGFWWFEAEMAGIDYDAVGEDIWQRYARAMSGGYPRAAMIQVALDQEKQPKAPDPHDPRKGPQLDDYWVKYFEQKLKNVPVVEEVHRLFQHQIDRGWSILFQDLVAGAIAGYGWLDLTQDEIRERARKGLTAYDSETGEGDVFLFGNLLPEADAIGPLLPCGAMVEIAGPDWSLSGLAPDNIYITSSDRRYWDVIIDCHRLFERFPRPLLSRPGGIEDTIQVLTPSLATSRDNDHSQPLLGPPTHSDIRRGPGRKKLEDGAVEKACHELVGRRYANGEDELSLHAEAASFAQKVWGVSLARSTFQDYMKPFKRQPKNQPEKTPGIAAE